MDVKVFNAVKISTPFLEQGNTMFFRNVGKRLISDVSPCLRLKELSTFCL